MAGYKHLIMTAAEVSGSSRAEMDCPVDILAAHLAKHPFHTVVVLDECPPDCSTQMAHGGTE